MIIETEEDRRKFITLYEEYEHFMLWAAREIVEDNYTAEDIVHDVFEKVADKDGDVKANIVMTPNTAEALFELRAQFKTEKNDDNKKNGMIKLCDEAIKQYAKHLMTNKDASIEDLRNFYQILSDNKENIPQIEASILGNMFDNEHLNSIVTNEQTADKSITLNI